MVSDSSLQLPWRTPPLVKFGCVIKDHQYYLKRLFVKKKFLFPQLRIFVRPDFPYRRQMTQRTANRLKAEAEIRIHSSKSQTLERFAKMPLFSLKKKFLYKLCDSQSFKSVKQSWHQKVRKALHLNKGPGDTVECLQRRISEVPLQSVCQPTTATLRSQAQRSATVHTQKQRQTTAQDRGESQWPLRASCGLWSLRTDGRQHSPPLVYTSNCRLMLDLSTREWRTLRTLWTFQILGLERRKSISSSDFLAVLQRYWLNDWNCWGRRERGSSGIKPTVTGQVLKMKRRPGLWAGERQGEATAPHAKPLCISFVFVQRHLWLNCEFCSFLNVSCSTVT